MTNMTITADEETLRHARVEAAKRNISLSRFVGELLREKFQEDDEYDWAMQTFFPGAPTSSHKPGTTAAIGPGATNSMTGRC